MGEEEEVAPAAGTPPLADSLSNAPSEPAPSPAPETTPETASETAPDTTPETAPETVPEVVSPPILLPRPVAVVTGATSGVGLAFACELLRRNTHDVVCAANEAHPERAEPALATLQAFILPVQPPGVPPPRLTLLPLQLSNLASVADFASKVTEQHPKVHLLVLNAAVGDVASSAFGSTPEVTAEGWERTFAVNYLGHAALTQLLMPALSAAQPSRVLCVTCGRHAHAWRLQRSSWVDSSASSWLRPFHGGDAYNNSKVMSILFAYKFNRTYAVASGVTANAVNPGIVPGTRLLRDRSPSYAFSFEHIAAPFWAFLTRVVSPEEAALALMTAAEAVKGGQFFQGNREGKSAGQTYDQGMQDMLWDDTAEMLRLEWPIPGL